MATRITQEQTYQFMKALPEVVDEETYLEMTALSLHINMTARGVGIGFYKGDREYTYKINNLRLTHLYKKGTKLGTYNRVPLQAGSLMLWNNVNQYIVQEQYRKKKGDFNLKVEELRYLGTDDESVGESSISSNTKLPYRLTHSFITEDRRDVYYIQDFKDGKTTTLLYYNNSTYELDYLQEDKLNRKVNWGQAIESELSKRLKEEHEFYKLNIEEDDGHIGNYELIE